MKFQFHAIAAGGEALGNDATGRVVFAPYGAPGDVAEVELEAEHRSYARGRVVRLESASPQRVEPPCLYYLPAPPNLAMACGGCQLQHLSYAAQLEAKRGLVRDALRRIGGLETSLVEALVQPCIASPQPFHYRNKADFVVATVKGEPQIGFFARGSHHLIDLAHCPLQQAGNNELLTAVRTCLHNGLAAPFDPATGQGVLRRLVTRTASNGETLLTAVTTRSSWPQAKEFAHYIRQQVPSLVGVLHRPPRSEAQRIWGRDWLEEEVNGLILRVSGEGFFQVNTSLTSSLVETALQLAQIEPGQRALDLFCGVGLFGLSMARQGAQITGIEVSREAIKDARANATRNQLEAASVLFKAGQAERELRGLQTGQWDVLLLDPPRTGAVQCLPEIVRLRPGRIVYVSCDPATLARDLKILLAHSYQLETVVPLDLFPQTAHVETVVSLMIAS